MNSTQKNSIKSRGTQARKSLSQLKRSNFYKNNWRPRMSWSGKADVRTSTTKKCGNTKSTSTYKMWRLRLSTNCIWSCWPKIWTKIKNWKIYRQRRCANHWQGISKTQTPNQSSKGRLQTPSCILTKGEIKSWRFSLRFSQRKRPTSLLKEWNRRNTWWWARISYSTSMRISTRSRIPTIDFTDFIPFDKLLFILFTDLLIYKARLLFLKLMAKNIDYG